MVTRHGIGGVVTAPALCWGAAPGFSSPEAVRKRKSCAKVRCLWLRQGEVFQGGLPKSTKANAQSRPVTRGRSSNFGVSRNGYACDNQRVAMARAAGRGKPGASR
jgi:hypothetical protein